MCTEQKVTVGEPERGTSQQASNNEQDHTQVPLLVELALNVRTIGSDSEVRVASVRHELIGDVRNMINGFLKNNRMELSTGSGDNVGRISARQAWIPLKEGKTKLMMHEITVSCIKTTGPSGLDWPLWTKGRTRARGLGKGPVPARGSVSARLWVPARAVLALLLPVVADRA